MPDIIIPTSRPSQDMEAAGKPFLIVLHQRDRTASGSFRPEATVTINRSLRTSGLLLALPPDEVKSLLLMLTFVTPNGWCRPTTQQLAEAMHVGEAKARTRMQRLRDFQWQSRPVITEIKRDSGMDSFALSADVVGMQQEATEGAPETASLPRLAGREAVIEYSRAMYAHPRAEVERAIAERMGWKEQGDSPEASLRRKLLGVAGLLRDHVDFLMEHYPRENIERQLEWLPYRKAKSPARFLMAAIENDYDPPPTVRLQQAFAHSDAPQEEPHSDTQLDQQENENGHDPAVPVSQLEVPQAKYTDEEQAL